MGRTKLKPNEKKQRLDVFVTGEVIKKNGGKVKAIKKCVEILKGHE